MIATLVLQSFANPSIVLSAEEYQCLDKAFFDLAPSSAFVGLWQLMLRCSELMQLGRVAIASGSSLEPIVAGTKELRSSFDLLLPTMQEHLKTLEVRSSDDSFQIRMHASYQRAYGLALASLAILLCAQRTLSPNEWDMHVVSANLCTEVLRINHDARVYRPQAAIWTVHMLICTWCSTQDITLRKTIEEAFLDFQKDVMGPRAELPIDQLRLLERRLCLLK